MNYNSTMKIYGKALASLIKADVNNKLLMKDIKNEYKNILLRAKDIGSNNNLLSSYMLAAFFIAMNRCLRLSKDECYSILEKNMRKSKMLKLMMGNKKSYFSNKKMEFRRKWAQETQKRKYENDWVVKVIEGSDDFVFGFDYLECGVCKLCRDEGVPELSKYLCKLDFMLVELIGIKLDRTKTLAEGAEKCDFRFK